MFFKSSPYQAAWIDVLIPTTWKLHIPEDKPFKWPFDVR